MLRAIDDFLLDEVARPTTEAVATRWGISTPSLAAGCLHFTAATQVASCLLFAQESRQLGNSLIYALVTAPILGWICLMLRAISSHASAQANTPRQLDNPLRESARGTRLLALVVGAIALFVAIPRLATASSMAMSDAVQIPGWICFAAGAYFAACLHRVGTRPPDNPTAP